MQIFFAPAFLSLALILALSVNESVYLFQGPVRKAVTTTRHYLKKSTSFSKWRAVGIGRPLVSDRA